MHPLPQIDRRFAGYGWDRRTISVLPAIQARQWSVWGDLATAPTTEKLGIRLLRHRVQSTKRPIEIVDEPAGLMIKVIGRGKERLKAA